MSKTWPWMTLALLGAYHGVNPAMGWLFAVARGLQEKRRSALLEALFPIAIGHAVAIALVVLLVGVAEVMTTPGVLRAAGASTLAAFGAYKLLKPRSHPRWVGMRVSLPELGLWSFLMATAHGAGLMLFPILVGLSDPAHAESASVAHFASHGTSFPVRTRIVAVGIHSLAMLLAMTLVALIVYEKVGLAILRRAWVNVDIIWAIAIVGAGVFTLFT